MTMITHRQTLTARVLHHLEDAALTVEPARTIATITHQIAGHASQPEVRSVVKALVAGGFIRLEGTEPVGGAPTYAAVTKHQDGGAPHDPFLAGRQRYLAQKHTELPNLTRHQELLREHGDAVAIIKAGEW